MDAMPVASPRFFAMLGRGLPAFLVGEDTKRMQLAFFYLSALDILGVLESSTTLEQRRGWIDWIYAQQRENVDDKAVWGFKGSPWDGLPHIPRRKGMPGVTPIGYSAVAMSYTALMSLAILGDDLSGVDREAMARGLEALQEADGGVLSAWQSQEADLRFVYCACAICYILNDWSGLDKDKATQFIFKCQSYDGAFGKRPGTESHAGLTYCAVASLKLMGKLDALGPSKNRLVLWCVRRQSTGFCGRIGKPPDTCYSFWIGAVLDMLGLSDLIDHAAHLQFLESTFGMGGFGKYPGDSPDPYHGYLGMVALAILGQGPFKSPTADASLNVSHRVLNHVTTTPYHTKS